jgi:RNA polymerase sigma factor (sigma-70 family)
MTLARTACLSELRGSVKDRLSVPIEDLELAGPEAFDLNLELDRDQDVAWLKQQIDALPDAQRAVLTLRLADELSYDQIAEAMDVTVAAVKSLLFRAKQTLSKQKRTGS